MAREIACEAKTGPLALPWIRRALVTAVMLLCLAAFFRDALQTGLHVLYGDSSDGVIETVILNHWYRVLTGGAAWDVVGYFYPYPATLGYNDTYVFPGIPFTLARLAGADPFIAAFASHVAMKALSFLGMYMLLRRGLAVRTPLALAGAALFATANASLVNMNHGQLLSVGLLPWLGFLALRSISALRDDKPRALVAYSCGFAFCYGATALNAFYALWFFTIFLAIYVPIALLLMEAGKRRALIAVAVRHWRALLLCALVGLVALTPLLLLYLPKIDAGARHPWEDGAHLFLPDMSTLFNVGSGNLVWGKLPLWLGSAIPFPRGETRFGFPVGLIAVTLFAMLWAGRERARSGIVLPTGITIAIMIALALRWPGDYSAWWYVYSYVPGASAVRVVERLLLFALVGVIVIVITFLDRAPRPTWVTVLILAGLLVEEIQLQAPLNLSRDAQLRMLADVGPPPRDCPAFFVVAARAPDDPVRAEARAVGRRSGGKGMDVDAMFYRHNVDAMLLASYYGVPTINGYSSFNPPDWQFAYPDSPDYLQRVRAYADRHGLKRLCGLDARRAEPWFVLAR